MSERVWSPRTLDEAVDTVGPQPHPKLDEGEQEEPPHVARDAVMPFTPPLTPPVRRK